MKSVIARWLNSALYTWLSPLYDVICAIVSNGHWLSWQHTVFSYVKGASVLDLCCGTGTVLLDLNRRGFCAYGVDSSAWMLGVANRKLNRRKLQSVKLVRGNITKLPFSGEVFDSVILTFPTSVIVDREFHFEVTRVLRKSGSLIILDQAEFITCNLASKIRNYFLTLNAKKSLTTIASSLVEAGFRAAETYNIEQNGTRVRLLVAEKR